MAGPYMPNNPADFDGSFKLNAPQFDNEDITQLPTLITTKSGRNVPEFRLSHFRSNVLFVETGNAAGNAGRLRRSALTPKDGMEIHIDLMEVRVVTHIGIAGSMPCIDPTPMVGAAGQPVWRIQWMPTWITSYQLYCRKERTNG